MEMNWRGYTPQVAEPGLEFTSESHRESAFRVLPMYVRAAYRLTNLLDDRYRDNGFRVARTYDLSP